ncbi:MAG TPA: ISAs1 family transposase [Streptosporangiaceae bacterium]|nr:ISAs1 family transposase [Streptosporangiaceae bacterium]
MIKNGAGKVPGLLAVLALVPDPRKIRGRRYDLVFVLAVAAACTLAGAKTFREVGDHAADLPQSVLRDLGGRLHPLRRKVIAPSETRIRTLLHLIDTEILDEITGGWLRDLADAGRLDGLLTAIAIDGKWLRGVLDGQVKLFAAMLHEQKAVIAQHRIPDDTTETTQVKALLENVDLAGAVVTADAVNAQRETAEYIAGKEEDGGRGSAYFLFVKGNQPKLQRAVFGAVQQDCPRDPDYTELDESHGRITRRSVWVTGAENIDFPHVRQVARIRRDGYDASGARVSKEIVHAVTSLRQDQAGAADLAKLARGQWGIESVHWLRDTAYGEDANTGYAGNGPQAMATLRNLAISLLYLSGATEITRTLQAIARDRNRILDYLPL